MSFRMEMCCCFGLMSEGLPPTPALNYIAAFANPAPSLDVGATRPKDGTA